jgi:hypothetical protein
MHDQQKPRTYAITFAGRRDRMPLLVDAIRAALERGIIDEWHVWNYARTPEDAAWVQSLAADNIVIKTPAKIVKAKYEDAYLEYTPDTYGPQDVFVKIDDDIVYLDVDGLDHMISFRRLNPQYYIVSANVVNNSLCYLMQRELGCFAGVEVPELMTSGEQATTLHRAFLGGAKAMYESAAEYNLDYSLNINCIAWLGADLESVSKCESTSINNDEMNLSNAFPKIFERPACIFGPCVAAHLSFHTQDADMPIAELLHEYRAFVNHHPMEPLQK